MKKLKLLSLLAFPAIILPVAFSITACSPLDNVYKVIDTNSDGKQYHSLKSPSASVHDLLWGDKNFSNGNYVLFITRSTFTDGVKFLLNSPAYLKGSDVKINKADGYSSQDNLLAALDMTEYLPLSRSYSFVSLIEEDTQETYYGSQTKSEPQPCSPFDKYSEQDEKNNDKHKNDTYIRNDSAAKSFRGLTSMIPKLFDNGSSGDFLAIQWTKGYPVKDGIQSGSVWASNVAFCEWLTANDKKGDSWK